MPTQSRGHGTRSVGLWPAWVQSLADDGPIDVTVCIANWNCRDLLRACLESLHDQPQGVRVETVVVDNASHDGAADMVARDFPEVLLVRNAQNVGFATANNQAAARAAGRYRRHDFDPDVRKNVEVLMGAAVLLPRGVFDACGRWDEAFTFGGEDIDLSLRVSRRHPVVYLPDVEITHYGRVSSRLNVTFTEPNVLTGYARFLRKAGAGRAELAAYKLVVTLDAPAQLAAKAAQFAWRRLRGRAAKAEKSRLAVRGLWHFLTRGLGRFWRA